MTSVVAFMRLFDEFKPRSWDGWRGILGRLTPSVRELYCLCGRGAGKSRVVALIACAFASRDYKRVSGESIYIGIFAPDKKQAGVTFRYVVGLLRSVPALAALIVTVRRESIELSNGVCIEVLSATIAAPRGRAYALAIVEEASFLPKDLSANPDVELLRSLRPALARVPGSLLAVVSSPYARRGILWNAYKKHRDQPDSDVVFVQAPTLDLNPTFDRREVERAYEEDPASAAAEYGAQFRTDVEEFLTPEAIDACVVKGRRERPYVPGTVYSAFCDPAGGSGTDSFTLAIGHSERWQGQPRVVLDCLREARPPFSPAAVVADFATVLASYQVFAVVGDHYAGEWPAEQFVKHGIGFYAADGPKSALYSNALACINSRRIELLDVPRLHAQLAGLERRTARGGRDSIDHGPGAHDDLANVVCGVAVEVGWADVAGEIGTVEHDWNPYAADDPETRKLKAQLHAAQEMAARQNVDRRGRPSPHPVRWNPSGRTLTADKGTCATEFDPFNHDN